MSTNRLPTLYKLYRLYEPIEDFNFEDLSENVKLSISSYV